MEKIFSDLKHAILQTHKLESNFLFLSSGLLEFLEKEAVFSVNEELSDLSDESIKYLAAPFLHGLLILRQPSLSNVERLQLLEQAQRFFDSFINLAQSYSFDIPKLDSKERAGKIKLAALQAEVEYSIKALGEAEKDSGNYRLVSINFVKYCIFRTFNEQLYIQREKDILKLNEKNEKDSSYNSTESVKKFRPFVLGSTQDLRKQVFRPDHALPTLSIGEFYERTYGKGIDKPLLNRQNSVEADSEEDIYRQRKMDEYNDNNPKGSGNKFNRS